MIEMGKNARQAAKSLARLDSRQKNRLLLDLADKLEQEQEHILAANAADVADGRAAGLSEALLDRLALNPQRLRGIAADLRGVADLPDPVGEVFESGVLANGLKVHKRRVPLGVLAVIYEARPNVTLDIFGLGFKTGNAVILRGGSETLASNRALVAVIRQALAAHQIDQNAVQFIDDPNRALVMELLQMDAFVDMLIPRGGAALHEFCRQNSRIPVITGGIGICHLFVESSANLQACLPLIYNAKVQRPSVCNALDTLLVQREIAAEFLPQVVAHLAPAGVSFRAEPAALACLQGDEFTGKVLPAGADDFDTEWLSLVLGLKVVDGLDQAIEHIAAHSTHHSDGILTEDPQHAARFLVEVDSAAVYHNASTRFTDGAQLGLGAEVAISTQRLHARGPMGLRELTTYKWVIEGDYHVRK